jgi:flagellar biosynthesis/type III secretory pathway chaperone
MKQKDCRARLRELLQKQNAGIASANAYLVAIKDAIANSRLDHLQQKLGSPELAIDDIEELEQQRLQLLGDFGFERDNAGMEKCIAWCDDEDHQLSALYQQLIRHLFELRHSIQMNSLLVNRGQERVRRSIGILTGVGNSTTGKTYGASGQTINPADRRGIAVA